MESMKQVYDSTNYDSDRASQMYARERVPAEYDRSRDSTNYDHRVIPSLTDKIKKGYLGECVGGVIKELANILTIPDLPSFAFQISTAGGIDNCSEINDVRLYSKFFGAKDGIVGEEELRRGINESLQILTSEVQLNAVCVIYCALDDHYELMQKYASTYLKVIKAADKTCGRSPLKVKIDITSAETTIIMLRKGNKRVLKLYYAERLETAEGVKKLLVRKLDECRRIPSFT